MNIPKNNKKVYQLVAGDVLSSGQTVVKVRGYCNERLVTLEKNGKLSSGTWKKNTTIFLKKAEVSAVCGQPIEDTSDCCGAALEDERSICTSCGEWC
jgi:hypothetical protein